MAKYVFQVLTFERLTPDVIPDVFQLPRIESLVFPARLSLSGSKKVLLSHPDDFDLSLVPKAFQRDVSFAYLAGRQGIKLSISIHLDRPITPNVLVIEFNSDHLRNEIIDLPSLKRLIAETVPVFKSNRAVVYAEAARPYEWPRAFLGPNEDHYGIKVGWLSYFGKALVDHLGIERFTSLKACDEVVPIHDGLLVILTSEPFDPDNESHWEREAKAIEELGLRRFPNK